VASGVIIMQKKTLSNGELFDMISLTQYCFKKKVEQPYAHPPPINLLMLIGLLSGHFI
jgi:hypothetical protein